MISPVVTIDGPSGSGKGTVGQRVALAKKWHYLDSGAVYRIFALAVKEKGIREDDIPALVEMAAHMQFSCTPNYEAEASISLDNIDVSETIRTESVAQNASRLATIAEIRQALLDIQRRQCQAPGLVADGRDMGTTVFPSAELKIYLTASTKTRAERRHKQLKQKGFNVNLRQLLQDMSERDRRDAGRSASPMSTAPDAVIIDTSDLSIDQAVDTVLEKMGTRQIS